MRNLKSCILPVAFCLLTITAPTAYAAFPVKKEVKTVEVSQPATTQQQTTILPAQEQMPVAPAPVNNGRPANDSPAFGIAGFALGVVGLVIAAIPMGILAIIFSTLGLNKSMKGFAIAGLVLGVIDVIAGLFIIASMSSR